MTEYMRVHVFNLTIYRHNVMVTYMCIASIYTRCSTINQHFDLMPFSTSDDHNFFIQTWILMIFISTCSYSSLVQLYYTFILSKMIIFLFIVSYTKGYTLSVLKTTHKYMLYISLYSNLLLSLILHQ